MPAYTWPKSLLAMLATEELGFCCMYSFLREVQGISLRKVAEAMGVTPQAIRYWRDKKLLHKLNSCPHCHLPQTQLQLSRTTSGRVYFVRSYAH